MSATEFKASRPAVAESSGLSAGPAPDATADRIARGQALLLREQDGARISATEGATR